MRKLIALFALATLAGHVVSAQNRRNESVTFNAIDFPGATITQAFGINERSDVVGSYADADGNTHGFSWIDGKFASIDFPGAVLTAARGINDSRTIVGGFVPANDPQAVHGFVLEHRTYKQVDFPDAAHTGILGINERGDLVGSYDLGDINTGIGFFTDKGRFVSFEVPGSAPLTTGPHAINDAGQVAGFFTDGVDPNVVHAFIRYKDTFKTIDYPGASVTGIFGINERGDAVGGCICIDGTGHGFLFVENKFTFITYPAATHTRPRGVNDRGQIVGFYNDAGGTHGFIASPTGRD